MLDSTGVCRRALGCEWGGLIQPANPRGENGENRDAREEEKKERRDARTSRVLTTRDGMYEITLYTVYMTMHMTHETPTTRADSEFGNTPLGPRSQSTGSTDSESESAGDEAPGGGTRLLLGCGIGRARFRLPPEPPEVERLALVAVRVPLVPALFCSRRACAAAALAQGGAA